jgi:hypothetical protein
MFQVAPQMAGGTLQSAVLWPIRWLLAGQPVVRHKLDRAELALLALVF